MNPLAKEYLEDLPASQLYELLREIRRILAKRETDRIEMQEIQRQVE